MRPVHYTPRLLMLRGRAAAALIIAVITSAEALGPRWAGLLTGFPTILLPTLLIIHLIYGGENTHAIICNFPIGVISIIIYIFGATMTFPLLSIYGGTVASLALSFYLAIVGLWGGRSSARTSS